MRQIFRRVFPESNRGIAFRRALRSTNFSLQQLSGQILALLSGFQLLFPHLLKLPECRPENRFHAKFQRKNCREDSSLTADFPPKPQAAMLFRNRKSRQLAAN